MDLTPLLSISEHARIAGKVLLSSMDIFGLALADYFTGKQPEKLLLHTSYGDIEEMPAEVFFREPSAMPDLELYALDLCKGPVLDVGAGVGAHTLYLQERQTEVTALEISRIACHIMRKRGVSQIVNKDIWDFSGRRFSTLLLLMNGIGLVKNLEGLKDFLLFSQQLVLPGGQLLFDSSDIAYLFKDFPKKHTSYYGCISYCYEYKQIRGAWFDWLYVEFRTLKKIAKETGWLAQQIYVDENDQYLARLTRR